MFMLVTKKLSLRGFIVSDHADLRAEFVAKVTQLVTLRASWSSGRPCARGWRTPCRPSSTSCAAATPGRWSSGWPPTTDHGARLGQIPVMWLFFTRRLRMWLILTVLVPLTTGLLRRVGRPLERRNGPTGVSRALLRAGDLGDRARATLRGRRRPASESGSASEGPDGTPDDRPDERREPRTAA